MEWIEDSVVFRGAIRRSGNSLVITIPAELSQRLLLREGQEFIIYGIGRKRPYFEGGLQVYLGYFIVHEKVPVVRFKIDLGAGSLERFSSLIKEVKEAYSLSDVKYKQVDNTIVEIELYFGALNEKGITRLKTREEVEEAASSIEFKLRMEGFKILERDLVEKIIEWKSIDPSTISRAPYKISEVVRWRWEI
ncbi:MAG: hypothetical protein NZ929_05245 [Aigarchaeota archaeon]|nr:hypothetical protein [Aigarchaeota archaeon]MCX8192632.1 hypothetical protein [Nitrososphaeria archaeon]MDW7985592.1 hypothetical protein [Nitrososphaerota archaeon]